MKGGLLKIKMDKTGWKVTAIIFIILFTIETTGLILLLNVGINSVEAENECAYNICEDYSTYQYDYVDNVCYCFEDNEVVKTSYMK